MSTKKMTKESHNKRLQRELKMSLWETKMVPLSYFERMSSHWSQEITEGDQD